MATISKRRGPLFEVTAARQPSEEAVATLRATIDRDLEDWVLETSVALTDEERSQVLRQLLQELFLPTTRRSFGAGKSYGAIRRAIPQRPHASLEVRAFVRSNGTFDVSFINLHKSSDDVLPGEEVLVMDRAQALLAGEILRHLTTR